MAEKPPFITVDNLKIAPLYRVSRARDVHGETNAPSRDPFGVVDRVTISREAKERSLQFKGAYEAEFRVVSESAKRLPVSYRRLLPDASKPPR